MPVNLQHLQHAVNATKTEKEHFHSPCAVSGIKNNFNPTRNSESARRNAPASVHGGEIRDIKCKTGQPNGPGFHGVEGNCCRSCYTCYSRIGQWHSTILYVTTSEAIRVVLSVTPV